MTTSTNKNIAVEESKDVESVLGTTSNTVITIDEEGTVCRINSGIRNLAINPDLNNNFIKSDSNSIASNNSRSIPTYLISDTLTTTEANREIKELAEQLQNNVDDHLNEMNNITCIKNDKRKQKKENNNQKYSFESYYSLSDDDEWSDSTIKTSSTSSTLKTSHTNISSDDTHTQSSSSNSSSSRQKLSSKRRKKHTRHSHKKKKTINRKSYPNDEELCKQSLAMIKFLGTMKTRKLDLKHDPKTRRSTFLEWLSNIEVAFLNYKYTRKILKDYNTKHKIRSVKSNSINRMIYSVCYAFLEKM